MKAKIKKLIKGIKNIIEEVRSRIEIEKMDGQWISPAFGADCPAKDIYIGFLCYRVIIDYKKYKKDPV